MGSDKLHGLHDGQGQDETTLTLASGLCFGGLWESFALWHQAGHQMRFFLGYSGWGPAQLESELSEGSWVNGNVDPGLIFETPASTLWEEAVRAIGVDPNSLAPASGIH